MTTRAALLTRANALTASRLILAPALAAAVWTDAAVAAAVCFWLAVATDVTDGWVARRFGEASPLGGLVDHGVDALFVTVGTGALAATGALPLALPPLIAAAFLQYAVDSRTRTVRGPRPSRLGRWNGIAYYVAVAVPVMRDALGLSWPAPGLVRLLGWFLVATTLLSMADRLRALRRSE